MPPVIRRRRDPVVVVAAEPRLLRDALARVLLDRDIAVVDTVEVPERCDILVTSEVDVRPGRADLVIFVDPADVSAGIDSVPDLLEIIGTWSPPEPGPDTGGAV